MHVLYFFRLLLCAPHIEIVKPTFRGIQDGLTLEAATGDEMQVLCTVVAMALSGHQTRLAGMRGLDCDHAVGEPVMKSPHRKERGV
jgi:hypothetical protein